MYAGLLYADESSFLLRKIEGRRKLISLTKLVLDQNLFLKYKNVDIN